MLKKEREGGREYWNRGRGDRVAERQKERVLLRQQERVEEREGKEQRREREASHCRRDRQGCERGRGR